MSRPGANIFQHLAFGRDPLDDPLNASWDAVFGYQPGAFPETNPADIALLRRFHASETAALPSPSFFGDLERQLGEMAGPSFTNPKSAFPPPVVPTAAEGSPGSSNTWSRIRHTSSANRAAPVGPRSIRWPGRPFSMQGALAVLAILLAASLLILYEAVPRSSEPAAIPAATIPKPTPEMLAQFDFAPPMWGMPDGTTWDHMEACLMQVAPGKSFTTDIGWFTDEDGPLLITVFSGELSVKPAGPAQFYAAGQPHQPEAISPGQTVLLEPNETIVYSAADGAFASNLGSEPMRGLYGLVGRNVPDVPGAFTPPTGVALSNIYGYDDVHPLPASGASVSIQRLELAPYDSYVYTPDPNLRVMIQVDWPFNNGLRVFDGALEGIPASGLRQPEVETTRLRYLSPGPHTIFNIGEETIDLYFLVIEPPAGVATPTP